MLKHTLLVAASVLALAALAATPAAYPAVVLYQNDFSERTSLGPIGGLTEFTDYTAGNLVGLKDSTDGTQDSWIRRGDGTADVKIASDAGNQVVQYGPSTTTFAHAYQKIGSVVPLVGDALRLSVDLSPPSGWGTTGTLGQYIFLGGDTFWLGASDFTNYAACVFGVMPQGGTTKFVARDGSGSDSYSPVYGTATVDPGHWYRFVADLDLSSNTYSLNIFDMGAAHPTLETATPATPHETFSSADMGFVRNMDAITAIGLSTYRNTGTVATYDNIVVSEPFSYPHAVVAGGPEAYWRLNEGPSVATAADFSGNAHLFSYGASVQRGASELGPRPSLGFLGFEEDNRAPRLTGAGILGAVNNLLTGQNDYTAVMWVRPGIDSNSHSDYLLHRGDGTNNMGDFLGLRSGGTDAAYTNLFFISDPEENAWSSVNAITSLATDEWHQVALVRQGDEVMIYVNGKPDVLTPITMDSDNSSGKWTFGGRGDLSSQRFTGSLDEIAIFGRALSEEEIWAIYSVPEPSAGLLLALGGLCLALGRRKKK